MPAFEIWPFQPRAFFSDTKGLSDAQAIAYLKLLAFYWLNRGLPNDDRELARIVDKDQRTWQAHYRKRLQKFFDQGWRHARMERDLAAAAAYHQSQRRKAKRRWGVSQPVDNGDRVLRGANRVAENSFLNDFNEGPNAGAYAGAMPLSKITKSLSLARGRVAGVDKLKNLAQASAVVDPGNVPKDSLQPAAYRRASQKVERALLAALGEAAFADAVDILAADPALMDRATKAELRKPGSGAMAVMIVLRRRIKGDDVF